MERFLNIVVAGVNDLGRGFCAHAAAMFVQSAVLIAVLFAVDLVLRRRVRATLRYWVWMLVFVKLLLPPTLALPTGVGYWIGGFVAQPAAIVPPVPGTAAAQTPVAAAAPSETVARAPVSAAPLPRDEVPPAAVEPAQSATVGGAHLTWQGGVLLLWIVGVVVFTGWVIQRLRFVRRLLAEAELAEGPSLDLLDQCRRRLGVRRRIALKVSACSLSPAVCGLLRPTILIPAALVEKLTPDNLRAVLLHELAHVKRSDLWVNCLQTALQIVYFYNPLVWLANALVRRVREQAVDEMVLVALGAEAGSYGRTLIDIAEMASLHASPALALVGVAESKKSLEGRIRHMITRPMPKNARVGVTSVLVVAAIGAILLPMARGEVETAEPRFTANLPNGVAVEFVGICNWATGKPACWRPDGSPFEMSMHAKAWDRPRAANDFGFMFRVARRGDFDLTWAIDEAQASSSSGDILDTQGNRLDDYRAITISVAEAPKQITVRVGFAGGPWSTTWRHGGTGAQAEGGDAGGILWSQAFEDSEGTHVVASTPGDAVWARRVVAIDTTDKMHMPSRMNSTSVMHIDQLTATFENLRREDIKELQYQVRPYEWVRFVGVSLRRGEMTHFRVERQTAASKTVSPGERETLPHARDAVVPLESARRLADLGKAVLLYANDYADQLPARMVDVREYLNEEETQWLLANVVYLGQHLSLADYPGRAVAYDRTMLAEGKGTNVLYLDSHVDFENPQELERLGISSVRWDAALRTYEVNRSVADFPRAEDFSTPEAAYAAINRIDRDDPSAWQKVSIAALAEQFARQKGPGRTTADSEWARVLHYARIIEVMVWDSARAAVMAQLPQGMSSRKIVAPIDVRYLERENGRWLNSGNDRFWTVEEAKATFLARLAGAERKAAEEQQVDPVAVLQDLKHLALAAILYAEDHQGDFASDLAALRPYLREEKPFAHIAANVTYLGKGAKRSAVASPGTTPLAYWKTATAADGIAVAFFDGHAEMVRGDRLTKLGIQPKP
jgi:beta-lactamase regulating signal transducer with metallopeptidase domain